MAIPETHASKSEAKLDALFDKIRRDLTISGAWMISTWVGFLLAIKFLC